MFCGGWYRISTHISGSLAGQLKMVAEAASGCSRVPLWIWMEPGWAYWTMTAVHQWETRICPTAPQPCPTPSLGKEALATLSPVTDLISKSVCARARQISEAGSNSILYYITVSVWAGDGTVCACGNVGQCVVWGQCSQTHAHKPALWINGPMSSFSFTYTSVGFWSKTQVFTQQE